ncbi:hypothetical protein Salat_2496800, partial [Sesamum alatum]
DTIYSDNIEEREEAGTPAIIQKIHCKSAAKTCPQPTHLGFGKHHCQETAHSVFPHTLHHLFLLITRRSRPGLWRETGNTIDKPLHGPFVAKLLNDLFGIQARGGCACAGPYGHSLLNVDEPHSLAFRSAIQKGYSGIKPGWTRVSFPYYMSEEEFEFILTAIEFLAIYGQRFLPCYHFSWRKGTWTFKDKYYYTVLRGTTLATMINELNLECNEDQTILSKEKDLLRKYTKYLEMAKRIASLLPKFPPHRRVPEDIDIDLLPFRA